MALTPQPYIEQPDLRPAIALIVDDPAPCINPLWYYRHQVDGQAAPAHQRTIPLAFMEDWCRWVTASGVRGDFTILPFPAGLGRIDRGLDGFDMGDLRAWMRLARTAVAPQFDIHGEILTHTNALDLASGRMLPVSEQDWTEAQGEEALAEYFAAALQILADAGVPAHGMTQPCYYRADESVYARALLAAEKRVNGRGVTHNFLHMDSVSSRVPPRVTHLDEAAGEAVVSVWTGTDDYLWNAQEEGHPDRSLPPQVLADRFLTADGQGGRLADLRRGGGPLVLVTHWQSLFSNGTGLGLQAMAEVAARVDALWGDGVAWRKLSEIASHHLAATTARLEATADRETVEVIVTSPFDADILTLSVPVPWPLYRGPVVTLDGRPLPQASGPGDLAAGRWLMRGSLVTVSLAVRAGRTHFLAIRSQGGA